jgi:hypothetical protein
LQHPLDEMSKVEKEEDKEICPICDNPYNLKEHITAAHDGINTDQVKLFLNLHERIKKLEGK